MRTQIDAVTHDGNAAQASCFAPVKVNQPFFVKLPFEVSAPISQQHPQTLCQTFTLLRERLPTSRVITYLSPPRAGERRANQFTCDSGRAEVEQFDAVGAEQGSVMNRLRYVFRDEVKGGLEFVNHLSHHQIKPIGLAESFVADRQRNLRMNIGKTLRPQSRHQILFINRLIAQPPQSILRSKSTPHHQPINLGKSPIRNRPNHQRTSNRHGLPPQFKTTK